MTAESLFGCATPTTAQAASFHTTLPRHLLNTLLLITDTHTPSFLSTLLCQSGTQWEVLWAQVAEVWTSKQCMHLGPKREIKFGVCTWPLSQHHCSLCHARFYGNGKKHYLLSQSTSKQWEALGIHQDSTHLLVTSELFFFLTSNSVCLSLPQCCLSVLKCFSAWLTTMDGPPSPLKNLLFSCTQSPISNLSTVLLFATLFPQPPTEQKWWVRKGSLIGS